MGQYNRSFLYTEDKDRPHLFNEQSLLWVRMARHSLATGQLIQWARSIDCSARPDFARQAVGNGTQHDVVEDRYGGHSETIMCLKPNRRNVKIFHRFDGSSEKCTCTNHTCVSCPRGESHQIWYKNQTRNIKLRLFLRAMVFFFNPANFPAVQKTRKPQMWIKRLRSVSPSDFHGQTIAWGGGVIQTLSLR